MNTVTIRVPYGKRGEQRVADGYKEVSGLAVGPFVVHEDIDDDTSWTVTHAASGYAVQRSLPALENALWLARELNELPVWDFDTPEGVKKIRPRVLGQIHAARGAAMWGEIFLPLRSIKAETQG